VNINNENKWVDVEAVGGTTGTKYFGRFKIKPYLTHLEKSEVSRLAELYNRGISSDPSRRQFNMLLAFLQFHIVETDATSSWWKDSEGGLSLYDEEPVYSLSEAVSKAQNPDSPKT
jgi:hypothetical protein